jgi:DNA-3-methyladenine glycosylase I
VGFPVADDNRLFEKICLEGFQAGLSWRTILGKRPAFREAFGGFDIDRVAALTARDVERLVANAGIVRHRGKIESARNNARAGARDRGRNGLARCLFLAVRAAKRSRPAKLTREILAGMATSPEALALSKDLKRRGFTFVGPTTVYAFMQAMGLVNDHVHGCVARAPAERARAAFARP